MTPEALQSDMRSPTHCVTVEGNHNSRSIVGGTHMYRKILVPVDGSETSKRGLEEGLGLAAKLGARGRIMHVVNKTPWVPPESPPELTNQLLDQLRSSGESIVHDGLTAARAAGVEA